MLPDSAAFLQVPAVRCPPSGAGRHLQLAGVFHYQLRILVVRFHFANYAYNFVSPQLWWLRCLHTAVVHYRVPRKWRVIIYHLRILQEDMN